MNSDRPKTKKEKELADNARLLRAWKKFHHDELAEALVGLHRDVMGRLMTHLKQLRSARELVTFIEAQDWGAVDAQTRLVALHEINSAICELRERLGLPAIRRAARRTAARISGDPQHHEPVSCTSGEASSERSE